MKMSYKKIICRMCLKYPTHGLVINKSDKERREMVSTFLPNLAIDLMEYLYVCKDCWHIVEKSFFFKNYALANEMRLGGELKLKKCKNRGRQDLDMILEYCMSKNEKICRLCFQTFFDKVNIHLYKFESNQAMYRMAWRMLNDVVNIKFIPVHQAVMCNICWEKLKKAYKFKKMIKTTEKLLKEYCKDKNLDVLSLENLKQVSVEASKNIKVSKNDTPEEKRNKGDSNFDFICEREDDRKDEYSPNNDLLFPESCGVEASNIEEINDTNVNIDHPVQKTVTDMEHDNLRTIKVENSPEILSSEISMDEHKIKLSNCVLFSGNEKGEENKDEIDKSQCDTDFSTLSLISESNTNFDVETNSENCTDLSLKMDSFKIEETENGSYKIEMLYDDDDMINTECNDTDQFSTVSIKNDEEIESQDSKGDHDICNNSTISILDNSCEIEERKLEGITNIDRPKRTPKSSKRYIFYIHESASKKAKLSSEEKKSTLSTLDKYIQKTVTPKKEETLQNETPQKIKESHTENVTPTSKDSVQKRHKWAAEEISALHTHFGKYFEDKNVPPTNVCQEVISKEPLLQNRSVSQIKTFIRYRNKNNNNKTEKNLEKPTSKEV